MNASKGFTLIELIAVIVILGVLAAVAVPRFVNLSDAAKAAQVQTLAGNLASGSAMNFAASILAREERPVYSPVGIGACNDAPRLLESQALPAGYRLETAPGQPASVGNGDITTCRVVNESDAAIHADFTLYGAGPS